MEDVLIPLCCLSIVQCLNIPVHTQPSTLSGPENKYRPKCGDAVWLGSKGRYGWFHVWINVWVAGKTVWSVVSTSIFEHFRDEFLMIKCYTNLQLLYFTWRANIHIISVIELRELYCFCDVCVVIAVFTFVVCIVRVWNTTPVLARGTRQNVAVCFRVSMWHWRLSHPAR